ncbi:hypothetical protein Cpir12675_003453 [Ceratocystis pirilliformis]|uniref:Protein kinase domain-containing protein n=1 Tax=Ceratocystis pirilliformis TaxID=259994 RepID=A0ABR3Z3Z4_9PEZI
MATSDTPELSACSTPTPTAKVLSQSTFFQERRASALPSPAEIRALNEASGHWRAASLNHPPPVIVPSLGLAVKYEANVTIAEVEAQVLMRERLQGRVPVPEVFGWDEDSGQEFIYMSLVEGDTLQARFSTTSESERQAVCKELRSMMNAWRALTQESDRYIGKRPLNEIFVAGQQERVGPFLGADAVQKFHDTCGIDIIDDIPIIFTHNNFCPPNILLLCGLNLKVVGIIDWGQSGWYPSYWEYCKARRVGIVDEEFNPALQEEWNTRYLPEVIDTVDDERFYHPWLEQEVILEGVLTAHDGKKLTAFPKVPDEKSVWDWLRSLEECFLDHAPYKFHTTKTVNQFKERKGQIIIFLQRSAAEDSGTFSYKHVLVVEEQKKSYDTSRFKADFLQLTCYIRGAYSSGTFDIHDEPDKLARALVGYATMDDDTMGLDKFFERRDGHRYVTLDDANGKETRLRLDKAMIQQKAIVCRGTTCYEMQDSHVAKFSWALDKRKLQVEQLKLAEAMGVEGMARVVAHRWITTITEMREGLQFPVARRFRGEDIRFDNPSTTMSMSSKRKSSADRTSGNASGSKRQRFIGQKSKLATVLNNQLPISNTKSSLYTPGEDLRVISEFRAIKELLESERDAIKAHRSLYISGEILHRNISSDNIIITNSETANGFKGMFTNLDLAIVRDSGPSGARHRTSTMQFMALEVRSRMDHTCRHGLESFFHVLLWMCAHQPSME